MRRVLALIISIAMVLSSSVAITTAAPMDFCDRPQNQNHWKCASPTPSPTPTIVPTASPTPTIAPTATPAPSSKWTLIFEDHFTTNIAEGSFPSGDTNVVGGWSSYPYGWKDTSKNGTYNPRIVSVTNGVLRKHIRYENGVYNVAAIMPNIGGDTDIRNQLYGRYEVRFQSDPVEGYKVAWLLWPKSEVWPRDGEIDFPEGDLTGSICAFMHRQNGTSGGDQDVFCTSTPLAGSWHTAVIEWEPNRVGFYLNGTLIGQSTSRIPNTPMRWVLQTETRLSGGTPPTGASGSVYIDYVKVWDYTP